jgi:hypothetical protein
VPETTVLEAQPKGRSFPITSLDLHRRLMTAELIQAKEITRGGPPERILRADGRNKQRPARRE